jgi:hypothetical protein
MHNEIKKGGSSAGWQVTHLFLNKNAGGKKLPPAFFHR